MLVTLDFLFPLENQSQKVILMIKKSILTILHTELRVMEVLAIITHNSTVTYSNHFIVFLST